jgi:Mrp family chromosome partitioning ATPase
MPPAPRQGDANHAAVAEAEARRQRVVGRMAALGSKGPPVTKGPPPNSSGQTTAIHSGSSGGSLPSESNWDIDNRPNHVPRDSDTSHDGDPEVTEPAPNTARMIRVPPMIDVPSTALALRPHEPSYEPHALRGPFDPRLVLLAEPSSTRAASFRVLRDVLVGKDLPRVFAVSSPAPRDGKTTCVVNLALAFAEQPSTRVLLVDANVFAPELGEIFGIDTLRPLNLPESAALLLPHTMVEIKRSLHLCAIPWKSGEPTPRFDQHRFDALIEWLCRLSYDYILLDTPAVRGTPETIPILNIADGTVFVVRSGGTTGRDLRRAAEQLAPNKRLGIALMDAASGD